MYIRILLYGFLNSMKITSGRLGKYLFPYLILISLLLTGLSGAIACNEAESDMPPYIPSGYINCIELTPLRLGDYFFNYVPLYTWIAPDDNTYTGKPIIMKDIEVTEEMLKTRNGSFLNVADNVMVESRNQSNVEDLEVGDMVDILGICRGVSDEWSAVMLEQCIIEPSGRINLPLENGGSPDSIGY